MFRTLIGTAELAAIVGDPALVVVDVRHDLAQPADWGDAQYAAGHLPGARLAHLDRDLSGFKTGRNGRHPLPTPQQAATFFGSLGIDATTQVVAYDQGSGMFASRLWWMLRWLGHQRVAVLDGGFDKWRREARSVTTAVPTPAPRTFSIGATLPTARVEDVLESLPTHARFIVDARAPERFRGEVEPMDPVAGHIPGAHNWPHGRNLNPDNTWKSPAQLAAAFAEFLGPTPPSRVVHHCGSGVTACHNILAMRHAGYPDTTLFPGSWSEWVADRTRPVATGER
ncbi:MAG TPA: sulfurtransferase [Casimicrobiaceae bacterium]|nr:sulfurtransferase [Casimicrobiaceae bacterium]